MFQTTNQLHLKESSVSDSTVLKAFKLRPCKAKRSSPPCAGAFSTTAYMSESCRELCWPWCWCAPPSPVWPCSSGLTYLCVLDPYLAPAQLTNQDGFIHRLFYTANINWWVDLKCLPQRGLQTQSSEWPTFSHRNSWCQTSKHQLHGDHCLMSATCQSNYESLLMVLASD